MYPHVSNLTLGFSTELKHAAYNKAPIRWFEPEAYKAKLAAAGPVAILPISEAETDPE
ncbi:Uncharacterized protein DBV15_07695 [Temnothorax longispinosus]|uniref:Uncharacterized protein n=1 Tax=Temnothorax longispinosus TaxID=300112 RepID=A0A4S2KVJ3_9HYME|nr:Uncharacterized protein DBV15_07695 [Temnothorax longispinosus]